MGRKPGSFASRLLVTDSARHQIVQVAGQSKNAVSEFQRRRPFVQLRSDVATVRSVVERVIGRMKSLFDIIQGPILSAHATHLSAFLIVSAGIINKMLDENPSLFVTDKGKEQRAQEMRERFSSCFEVKTSDNSTLSSSCVLNHSFFQSSEEDESKGYESAFSDDEGEWEEGGGGVNE
jgi:hypothetical protein